MELGAGHRIRADARQGAFGQASQLACLRPAAALAGQVDRVAAQRPAQADRPAERILRDQALQAGDVVLVVGDGAIEPAQGTAYRGARAAIGQHIGGTGHGAAGGIELRSAAERIHHRRQLADIGGVGGQGAGLQGVDLVRPHIERAADRKPAVDERTLAVDDHRPDHHALRAQLGKAADIADRAGYLAAEGFVEHAAAGVVVVIDIEHFPRAASGRMRCQRGPDEPQACPCQGKAPSLPKTSSPVSLPSLCRRKHAPCISCISKSAIKPIHSRSPVISVHNSTSGLFDGPVQPRRGNRYRAPPRIPAHVETRC